MVRSNSNPFDKLPQHDEEDLLLDAMPVNPLSTESIGIEYKEGLILSEHSLHALQNVAGSFLNVKDMNALILTSTKMNLLFKEDMGIRKLLRHAAFGEPDKILLMIKKNPDLLLAKGDITLPSGKHFTHISLFQLLKWSHDPLSKTIWHALLERSEKDAVRQFEQSESKETGYVDKHGLYYDFGPLMQTYINYGRHINQWNCDQRDRHWCQVIGGELCKVPAWVAQCFCSGTTWQNNNPSEAQFNAITDNNRTFKFFNLVSGQDEFWFPLGNSGLGKDFAIYSHPITEEQWTASAWCATWGFSVGIEMEAMICLSNLAAINHLRTVSYNLQKYLTDQFSSVCHLAHNSLSV